jgi:hypothetical protein
MEHSAVSLRIIQEIQRQRRMVCRQAARAPRSSLPHALWQDFAIIPPARAERRSPNIGCERRRLESTHAQHLFDPIQPAGIEFRHINLCKKVFDLFGLPL